VHARYRRLHQWPRSSNLVDEQLVTPGELRELHSLRGAESRAALLIWPYELCLEWLLRSNRPRQSAAIGHGFRSVSDHGRVIGRSPGSGALGKFSSSTGSARVFNRDDVGEGVTESLKGAGEVIGPALQ
jgi:hypothetical protein